MFQAYGLYTHINANRLRSICLLLGFVALLHAFMFAFFLAFEALGGGVLDDIMARAAFRFSRNWYLCVIAAALWFGFAYLFHQSLINAAVGAKNVSRSEQPQLYDALETLCISRGVTMPKLQIMETSALNAFASGISDQSYTITVTRGLLEALDPAELEAVLAHELTHIRNRDTQLMVVAAIFAGIFAFVGDLLIGRWDFPYGFSPVGKPHPRDHWRGADGWQGPDHVQRSGGPVIRRVPSNGKNDGAAGAIIAILIAVAIILISWGISMLIRLALSRTREYLADAGAVELTKNPDAMVSALRKISKRSEIDVPSRMEAFFIENPVRSRIGGLFSTHPPMEDRIEALTKFAGARDWNEQTENAAAP
ncbi:MAG: M48 family metallopeptidase [Pseudomonadota bacterium]